MIIAIDYDNTYTADPEGWEAFIDLMESRGHKVICVTGRDDGFFGDPVRKSIGKKIPVVFAGSAWKIDAAKKSGWDVNVWIDDSPQYVAPQHIIKKI